MCISCDLVKFAELSPSAKFREWVPGDPSCRDGMTYDLISVCLCRSVSLSLKLSGMFVWVVRLLLVRMRKCECFEPSQLSARKPHTTTPFCATGLAEQSRFNKLAIGHPD